MVGESDSHFFCIFATVHIQLVCPLRIANVLFPVFWNENFVETFPPPIGIVPRLEGIVVVTEIFPPPDVFFPHEDFPRGVNT